LRRKERVAVPKESTGKNFIDESILIHDIVQSFNCKIRFFLPTPVSALIHAATLVCAGVYVMVRLSVFYDDLIIIVGAITAIMAGVFGYFQADLKRVIAFSTCSQLGYYRILGVFRHFSTQKKKPMDIIPTSYVDVFKVGTVACFATLSLRELRCKK
jgi:NADH:ubiquinone oxidoreductase subunit 2 (subunit N)